MRDSLVQIRLTKNDKEDLKKRAEKCGLSISEFLRMKAFADNERIDKLFEAGLTLKKVDTILDNLQELVRGLEIEPDNLAWLIPYAKSKNVDVWTFVNIVLRTFKQRCLDAADKRDREKNKKEFDFIFSGN